MSEMLDAIALRAQGDAGAVLTDHSWLGPAIDADSAAGRLGAWGRSTVIDEHTGTPTVHPELFAALHSRAGLEATWPVGNAGLLHVYGYLLSTTPTPYGLKRSRWLDGVLARAYGLAEDTFVPWLGSRTLLERVTEAAAGLLDRGATRSSVVAGVHTAVALGRVLEDGPWALAYEVGGRLVTTFPVASAEEVLSEWDARPTRLRWNAAPSE